MRRRQRRCAHATDFSGCGSQREPRRPKRNMARRRLVLGCACRLDRPSQRGRPYLPYHHVRVSHCWCWCVLPRQERPRFRYRRHVLLPLYHGPGTAIAHERNSPRGQDLPHAGTSVVNRRYVQRQVNRRRRTIRRLAQRYDRECL